MHQLYLVFVVTSNYKLFRTLAIINSPTWFSFRTGSDWFCQTGTEPERNEFSRTRTAIVPIFFYMFPCTQKASSLTSKKCLFTVLSIIWLPLCSYQVVGLGISHIAVKRENNGVENMLADVRIFRESCTVGQYRPSNLFLLKGCSFPRSFKGAVKAKHSLV